MSSAEGSAAAKKMKVVEGFDSVSRADESTLSERKPVGTVMIESLGAQLADLDEKLANVHEQRTKKLCKAKVVESEWLEYVKKASQARSEVNSILVRNMDLPMIISLLKQKIEQQDQDRVLLHKGLELAKQGNFLPSRLPGPSS